MPPGIPYIVVNEAAERYIFYGMRAILVIFMTKFLMGANDELDVMSEEDAKAWFHSFVTAAYFFPILGAIVADAFLGKYRTIIALSLVYCVGHLALALDETRTGLAIGLGLIAIGSGGPMALAAARALIDIDAFDAEAIARKALTIAADIDVYTNQRIVLETLE